MLNVILLIIFLVFLLTLVLAIDLGLSVAVAFFLTWLFSNVSFEVGIVIGAICSSCALYMLMKLVVFVLQLDNMNSNTFNGLKVKDEYDEDIDDYEVIPPTTRPHRKRRRPRNY